MGRSRGPKPTPCMRVRIDCVVAFDHLLPTLPMGDREDANKVIAALAVAFEHLPGFVGIPRGNPIRFSLDQRFSEESLRRYLAARDAESGKPTEEPAHEGEERTSATAGVHEALPKEGSLPTEVE